MRRLAVFVLALAGCGAPRTHYHAFVDPGSFSADQIETVTAGLDTWHAADARIVIDVTVGTCANVNEGDGHICIVQNCNLPAGVEATTHTAGTEGGFVSLCTTKIATWNLGGVAAHEAGHAMGILVHSPNPEDLMYKNSTAQAPTANDLTLWWGSR